MELTINLFEQLIIVLVLSLIKTAVTVMDFVRQSILDNMGKNEELLTANNLNVYNDDYTQIKKKYKVSNMSAIFTGVALVFIFAYAIYYLLEEKFKISIQLEAINYFLYTVIVLSFVIYVSLFLTLGRSFQNFSSVAKYLYSMKISRMTFRRCNYKYIKDNDESWFYRLRLFIYSHFLIIVIRLKSRKLYTTSEDLLCEYDKKKIDLVMNNHPFISFRKTNNDIIYNILTKSNNLFYIISILTSQIVLIYLLTPTQEVYNVHFNYTYLGILFVQWLILTYIVLRLYIIMLSDNAYGIDNYNYRNLVKAINEAQNKRLHNKKYYK